MRVASGDVAMALPCFLATRTWGANKPDFLTFLRKWTIRVCYEILNRTLG